MGNFLFVSGQLPLVRDSQLLEGTIAEECAQALENIRAILEAAGGTAADIVQCTVYITDMARWREADRVYGAFFSDVSVPPACTVVTVKELPAGARIEIQAIAFVFGP